MIFNTYLSEFAVIKSLFAKVSGDTLSERLNNFYTPQAEQYDNFREKLLFGRREMVNSAIPDNFSGHWVDLGGGTGRNIEYVIEKLGENARVTLVDICEPLLEIAKKKIEQKKIKQVTLLKSDARQLIIEDNSCDVVTLSYSLTMIPEWYRALESAIRILKPGGTIGLVDFYVSPKFDNSLKIHHWASRTFWPIWFSFDNVFMSPDHLPYLRSKFKIGNITENFSSIPYIPYLKVPYYTFIGYKKSI